MASSSYYDQMCSFACLTIFCLHLFSSQNNGFTSASSAEAEALLKWKASFQNQTKNNLTSWTYIPGSNATNSSGDPKANGSPCNIWTGISCNSAGSVNRINLTNSGIQGTLHEFPFLSLPNLEYVDLSTNLLFGIIPPQTSAIATMQVTAKCDVYSFGVLALEVIMGKQPGDFISCLSSPTDNANILLEDVLDQRIPPPTQKVEDELITIASLAIACRQSHPQSRPTMRMVSQVLSSHPANAYKNPDMKHEQLIKI